MKGKKAAAAVTLVVLAAFMIALGLFRVVRVYKNYRSDMLTYESRHLSSIVSAGARGISWIIEGYALQSDRQPERREFVLAEQTYLETRDPNVLWALMSRPDIFWPSMPGSLAIYDGQGNLLAATDRGFPRNTGEDEYPGTVCALRRDTQGEYWLIFRHDTERGLYYELAVSVRGIFEYQSEDLNVGEHGYFFLLDKNGCLAAYSGEGRMDVCSVDELCERFSGVERSLVETLAAREGIPPEEYITFHHKWSAFPGYGSDETLVVTSPVLPVSSGFVIGAALSFREFDSFLSETLWEITGVILLEIGGALLLFFLAAWIQVINRRSRLELAAVRERMELMEEISRQQQSLAHTERLQQLGVMTSGIVHEFNNMLTPIMGQSMLLLEELADSPESGEFESALEIYESSENAREMLRRMSLMGKKNVDMGFHVLDICALLRKTADLASLAKDPHIQQELILPDDPVFVSGNDQLLTQAILNLCINACQAMGSEGTLTMSAEEEEPRSDQTYVTIRVSDTGPGISEEKMNSLYEPFFTTKGERGTGLGLAICQKIIETHKGTIQASNRPEGGAVFTVRLPVCVLPDEE